MQEQRWLLHIIGNRMQRIQKVLDIYNYYVGNRVQNSAYASGLRVL